MAQRQTSVDGEWVTVNDGEWRDVSAPATRRPDKTLQPVEAPPLTDIIGSKLPSGRTMARVGGGAIGGAIGATGGTIAGTPVGGVGGALVGGAAGASVGESLYQLAGHLSGASDIKSPADAAEQQRNALIQGGIQEVIPAAILGKVPGMLQRGTEDAVARIAHPATEGEKAIIRNVASDAIPKMPVAVSDDAVLQRFKTNLRESVVELERAYNAVPATTKFKNTPFVGALQGLRDKYLINGKVPPGAEAVVKAYDDMIGWFKSNPSFTITDLRKNKQIWDSVVNYYRGALSKEPATEVAAQEGANLIRTIIGGASQRIAKANRQVHTWKTMVDSLSRAETKQVGRTSSLMKDVGPSILGGSAGFLIGGAPGAAVGTGVGQLIRELVQTTAWQTASVPMRQFAIQALQRGDVQAAIQAITKGGSLAVENVGVQKIDSNAY